MAERVESMTSWLRLPMFFAVVGLHLQVGAVRSVADWMWSVAFVGVAVVGKVAGPARPGPARPGAAGPAGRPAGRGRHPELAADC